MSKPIIEVKGISKRYKLGSIGMGLPDMIDPW